jgi:CHASE2 domain-containing sensor protein
LVLPTKRYSWSHFEGLCPLANDAEGIYTPTMSLKNAALLALIGTILLTVWVLAHFIFTLLGVIRDLIPAMALLTSLVLLFASLSVLVFFYVFYRKQS